METSNDFLNAPMNVQLKESTSWLLMGGGRLFGTVLYNVQCVEIDSFVFQSEENSQKLYAVRRRSTREKKQQVWLDMIWANREAVNSLKKS